MATTSDANEKALREEQGDEEGPEIVHEYMVMNKGPSPLLAADVLISWHKRLFVDVVSPSPSPSYVDEHGSLVGHPSGGAQLVDFVRLVEVDESGGDKRRLKCRHDFHQAIDTPDDDVHADCEPSRIRAHLMAQASKTKRADETTMSSRCGWVQCTIGAGGLGEHESVLIKLRLQLVAKTLAAVSAVSLSFNPRLPIIILCSW